MDVRPAVASAEDIIGLITRMNRFEQAVQEAVEESEAGACPVEIVDLRESSQDAPVIKLVHSIIAEAAERGASDIHFEPQPDELGRAGRQLRVRMRVDGVLTDSATVPSRVVSGVVSRIKIMSSLDISERRVPQLKERGLVVLDIAHKYRSKELNVQLLSRVKPKDLAVASRQLATMVSSGMTILRALYVLETQTESKKLKETLIRRPPRCRGGTAAL